MRPYLRLVPPLLALCACATPPPPAAAPGPQAQELEAAAVAAAVRGGLEARGKYRISPADLISVTVYQDPEMSRKARVDADGAISLPLVGAVPVGGKTLLEAQQLIEARLAGYLVDPQVSLLIEEYGNRLLFVLGEVRKPGSYPIPTESRMTVLQAISTAGGFTPIAAPTRTRVLRYAGGKSLEFTVDAKALTHQEEPDMVLEPNDVIYVPQSFF